MKTTFTRLFSTALLAALTLTGFAVKAQTTTANTDAATTVSGAATGDTKTEAKTKAGTTTEVKATAKAAADTSWKPVRRLWGYSFGDFYYAPHTDNGNRGPETAFNGVASNRNAFLFRRLYLGYDYDIDKKFTAQILLASEPNANTGVNGTTNIQNSDNLVNGKQAFFIKNFDLRVRNVWNGTDLVIGEQATPGFALNEPGSNAPTSLAEATWGYRFIERTITDFHGNSSYDIGASLQGTFDPATKNLGYVFFVGNNTAARLLSAGPNNANTGFYKIFYGDLWGKFFNNHLYIDIYGDYVPTASATAAIGGQNHSIKKIFAAYINPKISIGVEAYTQQITNGVSNTTAAKTPSNATVNGISIWAKGAIIKNKLGWFARYDGYNPDTNFDPTLSYTVNTNYSSYNPSYKETFYTAGLDFTPAPKIHFAPNFWLVDYKDQRAATTAGFVPNDHTLVVRATFYYTFGK